MTEVGFPLAPRKKANDPKRIGLWKIGRTIGSGSSGMTSIFGRIFEVQPNFQGRVKIARHSITGQHAAIKIISKVAFHSQTSLNHLADETERARLAIEREIVVMKLIDHPNVMRLYDVWETSSELFLILEYIQGGELFDYLCQKGKLPVAEALNYFQQIVDAMDYCHRFHIAHRDLKPENILLDKDFNIKIADFGMAAWQVNETNGMLRTSCGSPHYAAPEIINGEAYKGSAADTWSCGVILYALLTGKLPFDHDDCGILLDLVRRGRYDVPRDVDPLAQDLLRKMLHMDSATRITMPEVMQHPFFNLYKPKLKDRSFLNLVDIAHPLEITSIDPYIFANLRTLWHDTPHQSLVQSLLQQGTTLPKGVYHLLMAYRSKHSSVYQEEEEKVTQERLERQRKRKIKHAGRETDPISADLNPSLSSLPPRDDPPTPRRAAGRLGIAGVVSDQSIFYSGFFPATLPNFDDDLSYSPPDSPCEDALQGLNVPESEDDGMQPFFHQIVQNLDVLEARSVDDCEAGIPPFTFGSSPGTSASWDRQCAPSSTPNSILHHSPVQTPGRETHISRILSPHSATKPLSVKRKPRSGRQRVDDKENIYEGVNIEKPFVKKGKGLATGVGRKRVHIIEPSGRGTPALGKKHAEEIVSPTGTDGKSSIPLSLPSAFSLPPFASSSPKRTWFGNVFNLRPATFSLISAHDVQTTRSECRRLLVLMKVRIVSEDPHGLGVFRCKVDEVKEPSGVMNMSKAVKFRVVFQQPQICGEGDEEVLLMSLTLIHEKGSVETFREICRRLEQDWTLEERA